MSQQEGNLGQKSCGKLYIVATPIGNLEDLTFRALRILKNVSFIACEDTRQTIKLLNRYKFKKKLISYFQPRERQKIPLIINLLKGGKDVALVSDAGTPGISDPGFLLIKEAIASGIEIVPIPGPSAVTTALSAAGLPTNRFLFLGFVSPKNAAVKKLLGSLKNETATLVFYLPARKLLAFLEITRETFAERQVVIAREITKIYEEFLRGTPDELINKLAARTVKGEVTILIGPS